MSALVKLLEVGMCGGQAKVVIFSDGRDVVSLLDELLKVADALPKIVAAIAWPPAAPVAGDAT